MQMRLHKLDDGVERRRVADRQFAEHLAIELDAGGECGRNESVVGDAALLKSGAEARDPQSAEVALALAAVAGGVGAGFAREFDGRTTLGSWGVVEPFGPPPNTFTFSRRRGP